METLSKGVSPLIKRGEPSRRPQHHPSYDRKNFIFPRDFSVFSVRWAARDLPTGNDRSRTERIVRAWFTRQPVSF